jgi:hypothetical protein
MSFSRNFYRATAVCSFISAATRLLLIFPPKFYGSVTSLELRVEVVQHPLYQLRAWAYLLHPFMVMAAALGVAAALRRTAAAVVVPGLLGFLLLGFHRSCSADPHSNSIPSLGWSVSHGRHGCA